MIDGMANHGDQIDTRIEIVMPENIAFEYRLLGNLINAVGWPAQTVVFLESGPGGPPIREKDSQAPTPTGLEIFQIRPTKWILMNLAAAGMLFCFARWPIFDRPRRLPSTPPTDFGQHLDAQAALLRRSRDCPYAMSRFLHD